VTITPTGPTHDGDAPLFFSIFSALI